MEMFPFCVITYDPIRTQTCSAPQNDRLNLSFVKDIHVVGGKWPEMVVNRSFVRDIHFKTVFRWNLKKMKILAQLMPTLNLWACERYSISTIPLTAVPKFPIIVRNFKRTFETSLTNRINPPCACSFFGYGTNYPICVSIRVGN